MPCSPLTPSPATLTVETAYQRVRLSRALDLASLQTLLAGAYREGATLELVEPGGSRRRLARTLDPQDLRSLLHATRPGSRGFLDLCLPILRAS